MKRGTCRVTFQPEGRSVFVLRGTKLVEAAGQAGIILNQPCGGGERAESAWSRCSRTPPSPPLPIAGIWTIVKSPKDGGSPVSLKSRAP